MVFRRSLFFFDKNDHHVTYNKHYADRHACLGYTLKPGLKWEDILRRMYRNGIINQENLTEEKFVTKRMTRHLNLLGPIFRKEADGT